MQERHHGRTEQDQRGSERHEEKMLDHVDGKELLVQCSERRAERDPDQK
jgi:hypothetical protein